MSMTEAEVMGPRAALSRLAKELSIKSMEVFSGLLAESGMEL